MNSASLDLTLIIRLGVALALGLIIGMERGWHDRAMPDDTRIAGIRTFGFAGLLGGVSALLHDLFGSYLVGIAFVSWTALVVVSYQISAKKLKTFGMTTELSMLLTFMLGALAGKGLKTEALAIAVVITALLSIKQELHRSLEWLDRQELIATIQLLLIAMVALPLLPDQEMGPWNALNPRSIGWLVLLIASLSYSGYFAMRFLGTQIGLLATAVLGALVSSTAVTISFGRMARQQPQAIPILGAGISLAAGTMALRILAEVAVVNRRLLPWLVAPLALLAIVPLVAAVVIAWRKSSSTSATTQLKVRSPIELGSALGYAALIAGLSVLIQACRERFGNAGVYGLAALSGITDVDAVSLSLAEATKTDLAPMVGATGILIAASVNTVVKTGLAAIIGGLQLARYCAVILLGSLGLCLLTFWLV